MQAAIANTDDTEHLPFVRQATEAERLSGADPRIFWSVQPSGDYEADCKRGGQYARQAIAYMRRHEFSPLLGWIVSDMIRSAAPAGGIEIGFMGVIAQQSISR